MRLNFISAFLLLGLLSAQSNCSKGSSDNGGNNGNNSNNNNTPGVTISSWVTKGDQTLLLQKQVDQTTGKVANSYSFIDVDTTQTFQAVDGFGYALTGGSAYVINQLNSSDKNSLLQELFGSGDNSIKVSYLRISMGSSDLNASVYSYDDVPSGQTDIALSQFSLSQDTIDLIPLLKQILAINPNIKLLAT
ncbi:MAG TPA: glucosylceramidase, partial [Chitinophagaceae bacterium]